MNLWNHRTWPIGVLASGLGSVGLIWVCIWLVIPDRPIAAGWWLYGPFLLVPYLLAALACRLPDRRTRAFRWVRISAAIVVFAGVAGTIAVVAETITVWTEPTPAMFASPFVVAPLFLVQCWAGFVALIAAFVGREDQG